MWIDRELCGFEPSYDQERGGARLLNDISRRAVGYAIRSKVGLDAEEARTILSCDRYADGVLAEDKLCSREGSAVAAVVINERYPISGGQPSEQFEQALRPIAAEIAAQLADT